MRAALAIVLLALGCDRSEPAPDPAPAKAEAVAECGPAEASELEQVLLASCSDSPIQDPRKLVPAKWEPTHRGALDGVAIVVSAKGAEVYGRAFDADELSSTIVNRRDFVKPGAPAFVLAIDGDAKLADVQPVLAALVAAEATSGVLLFASTTLPRTPAALHPEIHARLTAKLESFEPSERAVELAREVETLVAPCAPLTKAFTTVAAVEPENRCATIMRDAARAIVECNCPSWTPELVTWLQVVGGPADAPRIHADTVTLDRTRPTKASKTGTWRELVAGRTTAIDTLWLDLGE